MDIIVVSERDIDRTPAMCCVVEMEDVLVREFGARLFRIGSETPTGSLSNHVVFFCTIKASRIGVNKRYLDGLRDRGARVICYVFDSWALPPYFNNWKRRIKSALFPKYSVSGMCDLLVVPFAETVEQFHPKDRRNIRHIPLGVDSTLANGMNDKRPITVMAYGRQPEPIMAALSAAFNSSGNETLMYHTDHTHIAGIHDYYTHRRQFWKTAQSSAIALAYDPRVTHPNRFPHSVVGQRWFESLAAGCVVVGRRPSAPEAEDLLDWRDATLEAPEDPQEVAEFLLDLSNDKARLAEVRERNIENIRARHDWRHRFASILSMV